jgi:hypothetical protein
VPLRAIAVALAAAILVAGCGSGGGRRPAVGRYIDEVNAVQSSLRKPLLDAARAYRDFARRKKQSTLPARLARSEATIRAADRRLTAVRPPVEARRLHALLLRLVRAEAGLAHEVVQLARFSPRFGAALRPLAPGNTRLRAAFAHAKTARAQADALDAYAAVAGTVLARLRGLTAPPAFVPALRTQRATVARVQVTARELSAGLRQHRRKALPTLIQSFTNAGLAGESIEAQRARIASIKAYNRRVAGLGTLARRVDRERNRLERTLR